MKAGKIFKYFILIVIAVNLMIVAVALLGSSTPKPTPLPNPNGYDDFVQAGQAFNGDASSYATMTKEKLSALVSENAYGLKLLHTGLNLESRVPEDYSADYVENLLPVLASFKKSIFFLCAEGRLAELDGRTNDAAKIYLDGVRFGQNSSRGGVFISKLVGIACEAISLTHLEALNQNLDSKPCAEIARALENIDAQAGPFEEILKQEKIYSQHVGFRAQIAALLMYKSERASRNSFIAKFQKNEIHRRQVMLDFAVRAYELDHGQRPASAADLVPAYLKATPKDPVTKNDMTLSP